MKTSNGWAWVLVATIGCGGGSGDSTGTGTSSSGPGSSSSGTTAEPTTGTGPHPWDGFAETLCAAVYACGCTDEYSGLIRLGMDGCVSFFAGELEEGAEFHEWDQACADQLLAQIDLRCTDGFDAPVPCATASCSLFHGDQAEGESCTTHLADQLFKFDSDCAPGHRCPNGTCISACGGGVGEACDPTLLRDCDDGAECDGAGTCRPVPGLGEKCGDEAVGYCPSGLTCGDEGTCESLAAPGTPCSFEPACASNACVDGMCSEVPAEGEPCSPDGRCPEYMLCSEGTCIPRICELM